jgi:hypothetical protein
MPPRAETLRDSNSFVTGSINEWLLLFFPKVCNRFPDIHTFLRDPIRMTGLSHSNNLVRTGYARPDFVRTAEWL